MSSKGKPLPKVGLKGLRPVCHCGSGKLPGIMRATGGVVLRCLPQRFQALSRRAP
jgi:hypothetical protein